MSAEVPGRHPRASDLGSLGTPAMGEHAARPSSTVPNGFYATPAPRVPEPTVPEVVSEAIHLPLGSHCISFHVSREEAADHAVQFLADSPPGLAASYWVPDAFLAAYYTDRLARVAPTQVGCVRVLGHEQVEPVEGRLRPVREVREFVGGHPDGVSGGADTISDYLSPENLDDHLEYERWFDEQPRTGSRFLCPYDLRKVPPREAPTVLRELGRHHSHAILSASTEPAVRLLQLFVFGSAEAVPEPLRDTYRWATEHVLVESDGPSDALRLTPAGEEIVRDWSRSAVIDW